MASNQAVQRICHELDEIPGLFKDEDYDNIIKFCYDCIPELFIEIQRANCKMDIFLSFEYTDVSSEEIKSHQAESIQELRVNEREFWKEKYFTLYLKQNSKFTVSIWDDGCYMCPGYVAQIGYQNIPYKFSIVNDFIDIVRNFFNEVDRFKGNQIFKQIIKGNLVDLGYHRDVMLPINLTDGKIGFTNNSNKSREMIPLVSQYFGNEYAFFKTGEALTDNDNTICIYVQNVRLFQKIVDECEYLHNIDYYLAENSIIARSRNLYLENAFIKGDSNVYKQIEQVNVLDHINSFIQFSDSKFRDTFYKSYKDYYMHYGSHQLCIITEGSTDWKHLKYHWKYIGDEPKYYSIFSHINLSFLEYEPINSSIEADNKIQMDGNSLCDMCTCFSKMKNEAIYVFVADNDKEDVTKKLSGGDNDFKYWGNNIYSLVLPIPTHRISTPAICIEHYYSDYEIQSELPCSDGISRRLFLGNEFDKYGRAISINRFCTNRNACGAKSIRIIDGSSDERVVSLNDETDINYALGKMEFVKAVCDARIKCGEITKEAFGNFFSVILKVVEHNSNPKKITRRKTY